MIFICSFIVLAVIFTVFMLLLASGFIVFSRGQAPPAPPPRIPAKPSRMRAVPQEKTEPLKSYIDIEGRLIELHSKAEETSAKKQGFKVVYK